MFISEKPYFEREGVDLLLYPFAVDQAVLLGRQEDVEHVQLLLAP